MNVLKMYASSGVIAAVAIFLLHEVGGATPDPFGELREAADSEMQQLADKAADKVTKKVGSAVKLADKQLEKINEDIDMVLDDIAKLQAVIDSVNSTIDNAKRTVEIANQIAPTVVKEFIGEGDAANGLNNVSTVMETVSRGPSALSGKTRSAAQSAHRVSRVVQLAGDKLEDMPEELKEHVNDTKAALTKSAVNTASEATRNFEGLSSDQFSQIAGLTDEWLDAPSEEELKAIEERDAADATAKEEWERRKANGEVEGEFKTARELADEEDAKEGFVDCDETDEGGFSPTENRSRSDVEGEIGDRGTAETLDELQSMLKGK